MGNMTAEPDQLKERRKSRLQRLRTWASYVNRFIQKYVTVVAIVALVSAGFSGYQAYETAQVRKLAQEANTLSKEANQLSNKANGLATITLEPQLEALLWYSYSVDLREERDLRALEVAGIGARKVGASWQSVRTEPGVVYGWVFILNNGEGTALVTHISGFEYSLEGTVEASDPWSNSAVLRTGQALAIFLGPCGKALPIDEGEMLQLQLRPESIGNIDVSYETSIPEDTPKLVTLSLPELWVKYLSDQGPEWTW